MNHDCVTSGTARPEIKRPSLKRQETAYPFPDVRANKAPDDVYLIDGRASLSPLSTARRKGWGPLSPAAVSTPATPGAASERSAPKVPSAPRRRQLLLRESENQQSWRPAATLLAVLVGNFIMTQGSAMYAHGGLKPNTPFTYTPDAGSGQGAPGVAAPPSVPMLGAALADPNHFRQVGVCLMAAGFAVSLSASATFAAIGWQLARTRVFVFFAMSVLGFGASISGYYLREAGAERDDLALVKRSIMLRTFATTVLFYCIPRSFSTAEIVLANVLRNGWRREQAAVISFALGGGLVGLWNSMPILNTNPWIIQTVATTSSLLLIVGFSMRGTDVERFREQPPQRIIEIEPSEVAELSAEQRRDLMMVVTPSEWPETSRIAAAVGTRDSRRKSYDARDQGFFRSSLAALVPGAPRRKSLPASSHQARFEDIALEEMSVGTSSELKVPRHSALEMV